jgi:cobalamin biosynthesis Mg chelatase CobN
MEKAVELCARTRLLNPKWINATLKHGYDSTKNVMKRVEYLLGHGL